MRMTIHSEVQVEVRDPAMATRILQEVEVDPLSERSSRGLEWLVCFCGIPVEMFERAARCVMPMMEAGEAHWGAQWGDLRALIAGLVHIVGEPHGRPFARHVAEWFSGITWGDFRRRYMAAALGRLPGAAEHVLPPLLTAHGEWRNREIGKDPPTFEVNGALAVLAALGELGPRLSELRGRAVRDALLECPWAKLTAPEQAALVSFDWAYTDPRYATAVQSLVMRRTRSPQQAPQACRHLPLEMTTPVLERALQSVNPYWARESALVIIERIRDAGDLGRIGPLVLTPVLERGAALSRTPRAPLSGHGGQAQVLNAVVEALSADAGIHLPDAVLAHLLLNPDAEVRENVIRLLARLRGYASALSAEMARDPML